MGRDTFAKGGIIHMVIGEYSKYSGVRCFNIYKGYCQGKNPQIEP